ncbi:MAG: ABC transporter permease [Mesorhizobium sp.]|uniref:ABC transporter permease n=1 Tax=Mesorhizobium sp. WSM4983 TaxID=3038540 RepID=UPI000FE49D5E|nr:MAG: ABC transporter permease [Mesorhizobium sp.]RWH36626.1 MAG: ABC transporter permease [Mesorhizobium sp.]RWN00881.1 MAG: ABC transporter permease [Mesorhizobium sp.]TIR61022.1 MAG: ABC transporter permease [Mesorhizobium sp.]
MSVAQISQNEAQAPVEQREALPLRIVRRLANSRELTLFVLVVLLALAMTIVYPHNFPTGPNMRAVLLNLAPVGILVCGMMLLMIAGTFDLSVGSTLALSGVWAGVVAGWWGWPAESALLVGILVGAVAGLINGLIVTRIGINALIATLGTLTIYRSLTYVTAGTGVTPISDSFAEYGRAADPILRIQSPFWAMLILVLVGGWLVARTRFFRQFYFVGGNPRAAQLSGIRVDRLILIGFIIMGALAGIAGVLGAARLNSAVVNAGVGIELKVITATVLGGASLKGGEGTILGGILGVLFIALIENAMIINAVGVFWQGLVVGLVLLFAVSLDRFKTAGRG